MSSELLYSFHIVYLFQDWEQRYLHENWSRVLQDDVAIEQVNFPTFFLFGKYFTTKTQSRVTMVANTVIRLSPKELNNIGQTSVM